MPFFLHFFFSYTQRNISNHWQSMTTFTLITTLWNSYTFYHILQHVALFFFKKKGKKERKKALLPSSTTLAPKSRNSQSSIKNLQCRSSMTMKGMFVCVHPRHSHWSGSLSWKAHKNSAQSRINTSHPSMPAIKCRHLPADKK